jgi:BspA type Leucine rich repeat region (6 copies)
MKSYKLLVCAGFLALCQGTSLGQTPTGPAAPISPAPLVSGPYSYQMAANGHSVVILKYKDDPSVRTLLVEKVGGFPVAEIGDSAFAGATFDHVEMNTSVLTKIGSSAFARCPNLTAVNTNARVLSLGAGAFWDCKKLTQLRVDFSGLKTLPPFVFAGCSSLVEIRQMDSLEVVGDSAFDGCSRLRWTGFPEFSEKLQLIGKNAYRGCASLNLLTIPAPVTRIGDGAFRDCTFLGPVVFSDSRYQLTSSKLVEIGAYAFSGCTYLGEAALPGSVKTIGAAAFRGTSLKTVIFPASLRSLGVESFGIPKFLTKIYFRGNAPEGRDPFLGCSSTAVAYYPVAAKGYPIPSSSKYPTYAVFPGKLTVSDRGTYVLSGHSKKFGVVAVKTTRSVNYTLGNVGGSPLVIQSVKVSGSSTYSA